jgi:hypothetical protein
VKHVICETLIEIDERIYRITYRDYSKFINELIERCILSDNSDLEIVDYLTNEIDNPR